VEQQPHPKNHDTYKSDRKKFGRQSHVDRKTWTIKGDGFYIYDEPHDYERFPGIKNLGIILREWK